MLTAASVVRGRGFITGPTVFAGPSIRRCGSPAREIFGYDDALITVDS